MLCYRNWATFGMLGLNWFVRFYVRVSQKNMFSCFNAHIYQWQSGGREMETVLQLTPCTNNTVSLLVITYLLTSRLKSIKHQQQKCWDILQRSILHKILNRRNAPKSLEVFRRHFLENFPTWFKLSPHDRSTSEKFMPAISKVADNTRNVNHSMSMTRRIAATSKFMHINTPFITISESFQTSFFDAKKQNIRIIPRVGSSSLRQL